MAGRVAGPGGHGGPARCTAPWRVRRRRTSTGCMVRVSTAANHSRAVAGDRRRRGRGGRRSGSAGGPPGSAGRRAGLGGDEPGPETPGSPAAAGPSGRPSRAGLAPGTAAGVAVVSVGPRGVRVRVRLGGGAGGARLLAAAARGRRDRRLLAGAHRRASTRPTLPSGQPSATCAVGRCGGWPPVGGAGPEAFAMVNGADRSPSGGAVVVMNPRSGGGKVARFRLVERAQAAGAQVRLTGPDQDPASLAADRHRRRSGRLSASPAATARFRRWPRWPPRRDGRWW